MEDELVKILHLDTGDAESQVERLNNVLSNTEKRIEEITKAIDAMYMALSGIEVPELDFSVLNTSITEANGYLIQLKESIDNIRVPELDVTSLNISIESLSDKIGALRNEVERLNGLNVTIPVSFDVKPIDLPSPELDVPVSFDVEPLELPSIDPITVDVDFDVDFADIQIPDIEPINVPVTFDTEDVQVPDIEPINVPVTFDVADIQIPEIEPISVPVTFNTDDVQVPDIEPITVPVTFDTEDIQVPDIEPITVPVTFDTENITVPDIEPITVPVDFSVDTENLPSVESLHTEVVIDTTDALNSVDGLISRLNDLEQVLGNIHFPELTVSDINVSPVDMQSVVDSINAGFASINTAFEQFVTGIEQGVNDAISEIETLGSEIQSIPSPEFDFTSTEEIRARIDELKASLVGLDETSDEYSATVQEITQLQLDLNNAVGVSFGSMREAKAYVDELRATLVTLDSDSAEYTATAERLREVQESINDAMAVGKVTMDGAADSINGMRKNLRDLVHQYDALSKADRDSDFGKQLKSQIVEATNELKKLEGETGRFQRNVGNYAGDISTALNGIGISAGGVIAPINGVKKAMDAFKGHPIIAVLALIVAGLNELKEAFKRNTEVSLTLKQTLAPLQAAYVELQSTFDRMVVGIGNVITAIDRLNAKVTESAEQGKLWAKALQVYINFLEWMGTGGVLGTRKSREEMKELTDELQNLNKAEFQLQNRQILFIKDYAKAQKEASEMRADAYDSENKTAQERLEALKRAKDIELGIANRRKALAKEEYRLAKERADKLTKTSQEDEKKLAQLYANAVKAEQEALDIQMNFNRQSRRIRNEIIAEAKAADKAIIDSMKSRINTEISLEKDGTERKYQLESDLLSMEYELSVKNLRETVRDKNELYKALETLHRKYIADIEVLDKRYADFAIQRNNDVIKAHQVQFQNGTVEYMKDALSILENEYNSMYQKMGESDEAYALRKAQLQRQISDNELSIARETQRIEIQEQSNRLAQLEKNSLAYLNKQKEIHQKELGYILSNGAKAYKSEADYQDAILSKRREIAEDIKAINSSIYDTNVARLEIEVATTSDNGWDRLISERNLVKYQLDQIQREEGESEEEYLLRKVTMEKEYADKSKEIVLSQIDYWSELGSSIGSILSTVGDYYQQDIENRLRLGKISDAQAQKEFQRVKNLQIAEATINTIAGALGTFMQTSSAYPAPYGQILAAVQSAAVTAAGLAEISKIKATSLTNHNTPSAISVAAANPNVANYSNVYNYQQTGVDELTTINDTLTNGFAAVERRSNQQRVYIVEADMTNAQARAAQRRVETSF